MDEYARLLGYLVMVLGSSIALAGLIILLVFMFNRATWWVTDAYGGAKTIREFRAWYWREGPGASGEASNG